MSIVAQRDVANTKAVEGSQDAETTADLVQSFYADETCNPARSKRLPHLIDGACEC